MAPKSAAKRQHKDHLSDIASQDAKKVAKPDVTNPFSSFEDVVERLLPYHVRLLPPSVPFTDEYTLLHIKIFDQTMQILTEEDPNEADVNEANESGKSILLSRSEACGALFTKHATDIQRKSWKLMEKINELNDTALQRSNIGQYSLNIYNIADLRYSIKQEKDKREAIRQAARVEAARMAALLAESKMPLAGEASNNISQPSINNYAASPPAAPPVPQTSSTPVQSTTVPPMATATSILGAEEAAGASNKAPTIAVPAASADAGADGTAAETAEQQPPPPPPPQQPPPPQLSSRDRYLAKIKMKAAGK